MTADAHPQSGAGLSQSPSLPEEERLSDLYAHGILDGPSNAQLDRIVAMAAEILGTPIALISLVDRDRQWFLSRQGLEARETPRDVAFCHYAIRSDQVFVVADATQDSRFHDNPLVQGDPKIRFYAGAPLVSDSGQRLGTLCVIDRQPHLLTPYQQELLAQFSAMAMHEINHLRQARLCPLTAVLNRQALLAEGEPVIQKALLQGRTPVLVTVALAGLRQRNAEADGASWVDQHLERIAAVCRRHAWATGVVGRSGGGEFSLIWPDGSAVEQRLSDLKLELEAVTPPLQLRVVVTTAQGEPTGLKLLLERAAAALR